MKVRSAKTAPIFKGVQPTQKIPASGYVFPAPLAGWALNENVIQAQAPSARILDNWVCTTRGVRARGGCTEFQNVGSAVKSLFTYKASTESLFAATDAAIHDAESGTAAVTGLSSGEFSSLQYGTAGGSFLYAVNGSDDAQLYDGSGWQAVNAASSPIAITGVDTSDLSHVWAFANRIWFVEQGSMSIWYLPVNSIGGAATEYNLASTFTKGGSVLFGAKWSLDAGDGLDDKMVVATTEGEVAVFEGTDPGSAASWRRVGIYTMPRPLGKRAMTQAGGDLLIATEAGLIPVSAILRTDMGAMEAQAVTRPISDYWRTKAANLTARTWDVWKANDMGVLIVSQPSQYGVPTCLVANLVTGAWSRFTGWDVQCIATYAGRTYFGSADGGVYIAEEGGTDNGALYTASMLYNFTGMDRTGSQKTVRQLRPVFEASTVMQPQVTAKADYDESLPSAPLAAEGADGNVWDTALWDVAVWDGTVQVRTIADWTAVGVTGSMIAPVVQISFASAVTPDVKLVSIDAQYHSGAMVA